MDAGALRQEEPVPIDGEEVAVSDEGADEANV